MTDYLHNKQGNALAADWNHHHGVSLYWFEGVDTLDKHAVPDLTPEAAFGLAARLISAANLAQSRRLADLIRGDCPTCKNIRCLGGPRWLFTSLTFGFLAGALHSFFPLWVAVPAGVGWAFLSAYVRAVSATVNRHPCVLVWVGEGRETR